MKDYILVENEEISPLLKILRKAYAHELTELRRLQTQQTVYGERRDYLGSTAEYTDNLVLIESLIAQIEG